MHSYRFARRAACAALVALCFAVAPAPGPNVAVAAAPARSTSDADYYLRDYKLVTLDPAATLREVRQSGQLTIAAGLERFELALAPHDLRAPDYRAEETLEDGTTRSLPAAPVQTYAGRVLNRDGALARFTIDDGRVSGLIIDGDDRVFVEPLSTFSLAGGATDYVVYHASDVRPEAEPGTCGVTAAEKVDEALEDVAGKAAAALAGPLSVVQLATEADNEYVSALGSAQAANSDILTIVNQVDGVYEAEVGLSFQVVLQNTYAGADPYSSTTDAGTLLNEFRSYWNANRANVARDVAHMWTGRDMNGSTIGIGWVGVVCNAPSYAYAVSQRYTSAPQRYVLTAHEIGHNFGACHSDSSCNPNTGPCNGTIMQSFVGTGFTFCQFSRDQIMAHVAANGSCLSAASGTPPAAPSGLSAAAISSTRVDLHWSDNSSNETGFKVERRTGATGAWTQIATAGAGATSLSDTSAAASTTYSYRVRATNSSGDSVYSNEASATTPAANTVPAAPSALTAAAVSRTQINLNWTDNSGNETGFNVERSADGVSFIQIATVGANVRSYASTGLRRNRVYSYRVRAYNTAGNSGYSNTASARTNR